MSSPRTRRGFRTVFPGTLAAVLAAVLATTGVTGAAEGRLAVALRDANRVEVRDADGALLGTFDTDAGPRALTVFGGRIYVANRGVGQAPGSTITVADLSTLSVERTAKICMACAPRDVRFDAEGRMWFTGQAHQVLYWSFPPYDFPAGSVVVGLGWPSTLAMLPDGRTLLVGFREGSVVAAVDTAAQTFSRLPAIESPSIVAARNGAGEFWIGSDKGSALIRLRVPTADGEAPDIETVLPQAYLAALELTPDGRFAILADVPRKELVVLDAESGEALSRAELDAQPGEISVSRDGKLVAVHVPKAGVIELLSLDRAGVATRSGRFEVAGAVSALSWLP